VVTFFRVPGALLAVFLALAGVWFPLRVVAHFRPNEPMHLVWLFLSGSSAFEAVGEICTQILSVESAINPLMLTSWWSADTATRVHDYGQLLSGTCRFTLLAIGLYLASRIFRQTGLQTRLTALDWTV